MTGLVLVQRLFDEPLGEDLIRKVAATPEDQIQPIVEALRAELGTLALWREEEAQSVSLPSGAMASEALLLDHEVLASARQDIDLLLLLSPVVVLADPVWAWLYLSPNEAELHATQRRA